MTSPSLPGYTNLELIGKGGFSRVYQADQSKLKRKVAVKVLNFGLNNEADRESFARETELMGRVSTHPNIVTVHDTTFAEEGQPCIVMELYPGGSLADLINEAGRLNTKEALEVGVAIASALEASHQAGVLHCDLKPQNILISKFGQPALGDFGISTFAEEHTRGSSEPGAGFTLPYAAPEIVEGSPPTVAADIYSLAATIYTSLCGRRPFDYPTNSDEKLTSAEHARRILIEPVRSLVDAGVPVELDTLIRQAMSKNPAERPATAGLFASACHRVGQALGEGTSAPRFSDHGARRVIESEAGGEGQGDALMLLRDRASSGEALPALAPDLSVEASVDQTQAGAGFEPVVREASDSRRRFAVIAGALAVLAVMALLFMATRTDDAEPEAQPPVAASSVAVAADPIRAPTKPSNVELERDGSVGLTVRWQVPAAELEVGDVTYEVRRRDADTAPLKTTTNEVVLPGVATDEGVCVTVLAVRSNRTSSPTEPACATPQNVDVELVPSSCSAPCEVTLRQNSAEAPDGQSATVLSRRLAVIGADEGFSYDPALTAGTGSISISEAAAAGDYLIVVVFADGSEQAMLLQLTSGA